MIQKILVIGATGMLGQPVVRRLREDGFEVRALSRSPEKARQRLGPEVEVVGGEVEDVSSLEAAAAGCQAIHLSLDGGDDPDLERRGAENVVRAAQANGVERLSYLSGASVSKENCWFAGTRARFEAEAALCASGIPYSIFRATFFMETLKKFVHGKWALHLGKQLHPYHWVAACDYARMVATAYALPATAGLIFYVVGPQALTMRQALKTYCEIAYPEVRIMNLSLWMAGVIAKQRNRRELAAVLPFFHYIEQVGEGGDLVKAAAPTNAFLGAPKTTLEEWSKGQAVRAYA